MVELSSGANLMPKQFDIKAKTEFQTQSREKFAGPIHRYYRWKEMTSIHSWTILQIELIWFDKADKNKANSLQIDPNLPGAH